ncbi:hypothetical protein SRABI128_05636 [Microbacterium sp. Bi128]|nr:hypothetical protein SRABI128_05636 [Microbacterium sp. Bi128]
MRWPRARKPHKKSATSTRSNNPTAGEHYDYRNGARLPAREQHSQTIQERQGAGTRSGLGTAGTAAAGPDLPHHRHPASIRGDPDHFVHELEQPEPGQDRIRRVRELHPGGHRPVHAPGNPHHHRRDRLGGPGQPGPRPRPGPAPGQEVHWPGPGPDSADRTLPHRSGRGCAHLEARHPQPGLRSDQWLPHLDLVALRLRRPAAAGPAVVGTPDGHHRLAGLAVDPVHDAHPARRPAVPTHGHR